jgi:uncharacterized protein (AIM24 family)
MVNYKIVGSDLQAVVCDMAAGDRVIAETGHLLALTDGLQMETAASGGVMSGIKRALGGSSFFLNEVLAERSGRAIFASPSARGTGGSASRMSFSARTPALP